MEHRAKVTLLPLGCCCSVSSKWFPCSEKKTVLGKYDQITSNEFILVLLLSHVTSWLSPRELIIGNEDYLWLLRREDYLWLFRVEKRLSFSFVIIHSISLSFSRSALSEIITVVANGISDSISNPGQGWVSFTSRRTPLRKAWTHLFSIQRYLAWYTQ